MENEKAKKIMLSGPVSFWQEVDRRAAADGRTRSQYVRKLVMDAWRDTPRVDHGG